MDIHITDETKAYLSSIALLRDTSLEVLAAQLLEEQARRVALYEHERVDDLATLKAMKNGEYVDHESVKAWIESWGTDNELPCPGPTK